MTGVSAFGSGRTSATPPRAWRAYGAARALPGGVRDAEFRALAQRIDGGPLHLCPPVRLLPDGEEAFARMRAAIADAREEVLLET